MRLTKYDKQAIVRSIMNDIPKPDSEKLHKDIQAALVKGMSIKCRALYKEKPAALCVEYVGSHYGLDWSRTVYVGDADMKVALKPFKDAKAARDAAKEKLEAAIDACTTRKAFIDRFPEFSKYAPPEPGKCTTLPAVSNVVADLVKLGWKQTISKTETTKE